MILAAIGSIAFLGSLVVFWRRAIETRAIRWQLYALRDELRRVAYDDRSLLESDVFRVLGHRQLVRKQNYA